jgi:hypothetical protein
MAHARLTAVAISLTGALAMASSAVAQTPIRDSGADHPSPKWEVTFRGGGGMTSVPSSGTASLPAAGATRTIVPPITTRSVPSWFFGDGAQLFNLHAIQNNTIVPLDGIVGGPAVSGSSGGAFGVTVSRRLTRRFRLNFSVDGAHVPPSFSGAARAAISASTNSFGSAFGAVLRPLAGTSTFTTSSGAGVTDGTGLEWTATSTLDVTVHEAGRSRFYATLGGGIVGDPGDAPTATLTGNYAFSTFFSAYNETDALTIQAGTSGKRWTGVFGGGWTYGLTKHLALNADVRIGVSQGGLKTLVSTAPTHTVSTSNPAIISIGQSPAIVLDNIDLTGFTFSTLSTKLNNLQTFVTTGAQIHVLVSAGLVMRF